MPGLYASRGRGNRTLKLSQENHLQSALERFGMGNANPAPTPRESGLNNIRWRHPDLSYELASNVPYRQAIGCLMFLLICKRHDIAFAVCCLAQFCEQPLNIHWVAVKRILRYIAGTRIQSIMFGLSQDLKTIGYTDSDWGGCRETRKSTSGYVFMIAGCPVCRRSRNQSVVAAFSCEAKYIASCSAEKEAVWISRLIGDMSQGNKDVKLQYHYLGNVVELRKVEVAHCPTEDITAD